MRKLYAIFILFAALGARGQVITTVAGNGAGGDGSPAITASVISPEYLAFDKYGNLYFTQDDNKIRKIDTAGTITTIAGTGSPGFSGDGGPAIFAQTNQPCGLAVDSTGNVFFADFINNRIRRIDATTGIITTIAGTGVSGFSGDNGVAIAAALYLPCGLCFDKYYNLYVGDYGNHRIRKIDVNGIITTIAGNGLVGWSGNDGPAISASISLSAGLFVDSIGNIYIAEWGYNTVRKIDTNGIIHLLAGDTSAAVYNGDDILAINAHLDPFFVMPNNNGGIYISDSYNDRIREVDADGIIHTIAGTGVGGFSGDGGPAIAAEINNSTGLALDSCGNLYFGQVNTPRIRKVAFNPNCVPENVKDIKSINSLSIYPNPVRDGLTLTLSKGEGSIGRETLYITNTMGQVLLQKECTGTKTSIDVSGLPAGLYMVRVGDAVGRFVKE
jgi:hypothetical protein